jgi:hypothetical protein
MSENKLIGSLVLRTIDIDPTRIIPISNNNFPPFDNEFGIFAANGNVATWKNINLRTCLGELYYKYDRFNLKLTAVQSRHSTISVADTQFMIYMSGLPFSSGSGYNTRLGPTNQVAIGCVYFLSGSSTIGFTTPIVSGLVSFDKPLQNTFNITVEFKNSSTTATNPLISGYSEKSTTVIGQWSIMCDIYGIDK